MKSTLTMILIGLMLAAGVAEATPKAPKCRLYVREAAVSHPALVAEVPRQLTPIALNAAKPTDRRIANKVVVQSVHARRTATDTIEVASRLVNCTRKPLNLLVRTHFMDSEQYPTEPTSEWHTFIVSPRSFATYKERSIGTSEVSYFLIEYRGANQ